MQRSARCLRATRSKATVGTMCAEENSHVHHPRFRHHVQGPHQLKLGWKAGRLTSATLPSRLGGGYVFTGKVTHPEPFKG